MASEPTKSVILDVNGQPITKTLEAGTVAPQLTEALVATLPEKIRPFVKLISKKWLLPALIVGFLIFAIYWVWPSFSTTSLGKDVMRWYSQKPLPQTEKFSIAIAVLEGDDKDALRTQLLDSLRDLPGLDVLRFDRDTSVSMADNLAQAEVKQHVAAQKWLLESKANVLIWGQVMPASGQRASNLRLHFTTRDTQEKGSIRLGEQQVFEFPVAAQAPLAAAVRSQVLSQLGRFPSSHPVAQALRVELAKLEKLVEAWPLGLERATMQVSLGNAWQTVGSQSGQAEELSKSVTAYENALKERTRERIPLDWAMTQNNLGSVLQTLGEQENGTKHLVAAVIIYENTLKEFTREHFPLEWAVTQNNLGNALRTLGERENGTERLVAAVNAFESALKERTRERFPMKWAMTQHNLGIALQALGERENGTEHLLAAVTAHENALKEYTRELAPLYWATTQNSLGAALQFLGLRENGTEHLEAAVTAYENALKEYTRERVPPRWAGVQNNLGTALQTLGEREMGTERLIAAVSAYENALKEYTRDRFPGNWAGVQNNLGTALKALGEREKSSKRLEDAKMAFQNALAVFKQGNNSYDATKAQNNLVQAEIALRTLTR